MAESYFCIICCLLDWDYCRVDYGESGFVVSQQLYSALANIQMGLIEDKMGWTTLLN
ncbi:hypothetical protein ES319_A06G029600v1 [Gossypium barbadense]|uniref:Uncharacterized protein n=2 Tax=Gossypium TaxID=3633 RepID=A0A5J5V949_GOSBA|nr:hypothetical protein ES319_A06G029600v1 [Gossypium barbadense]TYH11994.1 hypothetical protein ES288_A06G030600v1 [Gossypium darwinii]